MLSIEKVDTTKKAQVRRFIDVPFRLYKDCPQWVPPIRMDMFDTLNRNKHPFYEHSAADFFIAVRDGEDAGRIAVLENSSYNNYHGSRIGQFYFFDCADDSEAAAALFHRAFEWAADRGLDKMVGPKGFTVFDGYGMLERGYEHRQMMNMMNYNYPYYPRLAEEAGFEKEVDFISHYIQTVDFKMPERVHRIADRVRQRQNLRVLRFKNKRDLRRWADRIGRTYNDSFADNWEYVPLTDAEIKFVVDNIMLVANPKLIKIIAHEDAVVGFAFGWPDVSAAMQRSKGKLLPFGMVDLLLEMRRTKFMAGNGMGLLPDYQGRGANALLYSEMEKTLTESGFNELELTQVAESAEQMRKDLETLGGEPYKNHRVYKKTL
jgi:GNAT superfamily N-acetyltransferase